MRASFGRIRDLGGQWHELMAILLSVIGTISNQLAEHELWDRRVLLQHHAELALREARPRLTLPHSVERVAQRDGRRASRSTSRTRPDRGG